MNFGRVSVLASHVFREVVRDRIFYVIVFYALILAAALLLLPKFAASTEDKMFLDFGLAAMSVFSLIVAIFVGAALINKEIEKRTVLILIAKPLNRSELIVGKYFGLLAALAVLIAAMTLIYLGFLQFRNIPYPKASIVLAVVFLFLQSSLITAVALTLSVFTSSLLATALTFAVYFIGHVTKDIVQLNSLNSNPSIERITQALYLVLPDLSRLDFQNKAVYDFAALPDTISLISNAGYGLMYITLLLVIAIFLFSRREF
ncbi:MAG: ABC transporter permease subunit [Scytonema sp. RU_4_4]|nr:ABC transporter permease subunit [Scytonema sp. RU_4_4]NJR76730.1 ABC transporter permease subunit [Scytonema sp. CRU_2_7]